MILLPGDQVCALLFSLGGEQASELGGHVLLCLITSHSILLCRHSNCTGLAPRLKIRLRDATGELDAFLFGEEALLFFFGSRNVVEAPASPGQPPGPSLLGKDLTPALGELAGTVQQ